MAFINEPIPEADKARIDWSKFKDLPLGKNYEPSWWTVDKEKNIFLIRLSIRGPSGTWPEMYVLSWEDTLIAFEVESDSKGDLTNGIKMFWKVSRFNLPLHLEKNRDEIIAALKEAVSQFGWNYNCEKVKSVDIQLV